MKLAEAMTVINAYAERQKRGFRVVFSTLKSDMRNDTYFATDFFPDENEQGFNSLEEAWLMASKFAAANKSHYNVYVSRYTDFDIVPFRDNRIKLNAYRESGSSTYDR